MKGAGGGPQRTDRTERTERTLPPTSYWYVHFLSGGIAGVVSKTVVAPLDRVKILLQTKNPRYYGLGVFRTLVKINETEGVQALWKGNGATIIRVFPYAAIQFMSYEKFKKLIIPQDGKKNSLLHLTCGSLAGATAVIFTYPLDLIRARLAAQVEVDRYRNSFHGLREMYRQEGPTSWFKGMRATLQGIVPYAGINFSVFETLKFYSPKDERGELPPIWKLICGGIAGPVGQTVSYPFDTVRRRQQTWGFAQGTQEVIQKSTWVVMKQILREEGIRGLFKGISINYLKATPTVGITFFVYETLKSSFTRLHHEKLEKL